MSTTVQEIATKTYRNLIGGKWVDAKSGKTFRSVSPANHDEEIGVFRHPGPRTWTLRSPPRRMPFRRGA